MAKKAEGMAGFAEMVKESAEARLGDGFNISPMEVTKNNGLVLTGVTVREEGREIAPTIYIDDFYGDYRRGRDFGDIMDDILKAYRNGREPGFDIGNITDFQAARDRICFRLVNTERNRGRLEGMPSVPFMDLSAVFYVALTDGDGGTATAEVDSRLAGIWGAGAETLFAVAKENTERMFPGVVVPMADVMAGIAGGGRAGGGPENGLYVATNSTMLNGAAVLLYDGLLERFAHDARSDFFILPSSVHELLFMPETSGMDAGEIREMVWEVNRTAVSPEEILSDSVYRYSRTAGTVGMLPAYGVNPAVRHLPAAGGGLMKTA